MPAPLAFKNFLRFIFPPPWMVDAAVAAAAAEQSAFTLDQSQFIFRRRAGYCGAAFARPAPFAMLPRMQRHRR
jgi:hypothetical protein